MLYEDKKTFEDISAYPRKNQKKNNNMEIYALFFFF